jgi:predicted RNase H-like nuclease (RuvC/YqgF family)
MPFHFDLNVVLGIAGGIVGLGVYFRTANLNTLKVEVESLIRQVSSLETRCNTLESERDMARREIVQHYTARTEIAAENRELHKLVEERDETIIDLQRELLTLQKR